MVILMARKKLRKTQREIAGELGISEVYYRKLESGYVKPGIQTLLKMEQYFDISMRDLFADVFEPESHT